ncbi:caltractin-like [Diaphorina citri]|uniref:Caltractin-like n=1 Tax=Diaphorina citri TaxID=121845 RepID=A0A3Q0IP54_DIACI|nr:caltractin-like [Diaphorina citri]
MLFFCSHGSLFIDLDRESLKVDEFVEDEDGISRETFIRMLMAKLTTTAHNITFKEIVSAFKLLDLDQTGMITNRSLAKLIRKIDEPITDEEITAIIKQFDIHGKGEINYEDLHDRMRLHMEKKE